MYLASDVLTLMNYVCKKTDTIYMELGLDLGYYFLTPHLVINLFLETSDEKIGLITNVDQHLFVEISMRRGYIFNRDRILKTDPTGQRTSYKSNAVSWI